MVARVHIRIAMFSMVVFCHLAAFGEETQTKETFNANAIALGKGLAGNLEITITRWTSAEEREALLKALVDQGQEAMIKILEKQKETGFLRLPNRLGYRLYYAHQIQEGTKRRIVLATDRPVSIVEAWKGGRSLDYAITLLQLQLDENNKGEGWLGFAMKLKMDPEKKTLAIENYGTDPVQLKSVRKTN